MFKWKHLLLIASLVAIQPSAQPSPNSSEDIAIIVNQYNFESLSRKDVTNILMGRLTRYPIDKSSIRVVMLSDLGVTEDVASYLDTNTQGYGSTWSKLVFTGKVKPPIYTDNPNRVVDYVVSNETAIGYVPMKYVTNDVRIVLVIKSGQIDL